MPIAVSRAALLRAGAALASAGVASAPQVVRAADLIPLQVGAMPTDGSAEAHYAVDQGWFKAAGLDVTVTTMTNTASLAAAVMQQAARWANGHRKESAAILGRVSKLSPEVLAVMTRSYYGEEKPDPVLFQPPINAAAKYGTLSTMPAADLLWSGS